MFKIGTGVLFVSRLISGESIVMPVLAMSAAMMARPILTLAAENPGAIVAAGAVAGFVAAPIAVTSAIVAGTATAVTLVVAGAMATATAVTLAAAPVLLPLYATGKVLSSL